MSDIHYISSKSEFISVSIFLQFHIIIDKEGCRSIWNVLFYLGGYHTV